MASYVQIIDVRATARYAQAADCVAGATWRDPVHLAEWSRELDTSKPVLAYCVHGNAVSQSAALALRALGLDARFVAGGIDACRATGVTLKTKERR
ncbi:MAG: sulfurtransferase [Candidimonas sp.]|nr:MAG: sulfurtransferase [Candidimonas sp.]